MKKIKALVMSILGLTEMPTKEGKVDFSEEQKNTLKTEFAKMGPDFLANLEIALNAELENKTEAEKNEASNNLMASLKMELEGQITEMGKKFEAVNAENKKLQEKVAKLSLASEEDAHSAEEAGAGATVVPFKPDMKMSHNKYAQAYIGGNVDLSIAATTIDVADMASEFGAYMSQFNISLEVIKKLTQKTVSEAYMTTKLAITEWKASATLITSVVQQFIAKWTPLGQSKFTPITITNYRHKINVPITPDEIMDSWLAYLYDESLSPEAMPITKYILEQLILPKVEEDRELRLIGKGVYEALGGGVTEGDPGQATGKSMNGFCTILKNEKDSGTSAINFATLEPITDENIVEQMEKFVDGIDELYQGIPMPIFCSLDTYKQYKRAYQKLYPTTKGVDKTEDMIDFSQNRLVWLPSMSGEGLFFATPKENFIRLQHKNTGASKILMEKRRYDVEISAEWWEGVGFAIGEAVFAYVPDEGSGSGS
jgi:hypothetical protein